MLKTDWWEVLAGEGGGGQGRFSNNAAAQPWEGRISCSIPGSTGKRVGTTGERGSMLAPHLEAHVRGQVWGMEFPWRRRTRASNDLFKKLLLFTYSPGFYRQTPDRHVKCMRITFLLRVQVWQKQIPLMFLLLSSENLKNPELHRGEVSTV